MNAQFIRRAATITALAGGLVTAGAVDSASASVSDPVLYATAQSPYAPPCSYSASLQWERATSRLTGSAWLQNHMWFEACRKKLVVTLIDDEGNSAATTEIVLPTACATTDPSCPSGSNTPINQSVSVSKYVKPYVDHMNAEITDRPK